MKYVIDTDVCIREQVSLPIVLYTMLVQSGTNLEEVKKDALQKDVVVERGEELLVTEAWADKVARVLLLSDNEVPKEDRLDALAVALMEIFPKGKKEGTSVYWKGNKKDTPNRIRRTILRQDTRGARDSYSRSGTQTPQLGNGCKDYR